jgi:hypothetical protein
MDLVERIGRRAHRGVEAEARLGSGDIVVNRLGDPHDRDALAEELVGERQAAISADRDEGIQPVGPEGRDEIIGAVDLAERPVRPAGEPLEWVSPIGGAKNGPAEMSDSPHIGRS